jgi:hypothetical protein
MFSVPDNKEVWAYCPVCQARFAITHLVKADPELFDLSPVERHIVTTHRDLKGNRHVPNIRVIWRVTDQPPPRT